MTQEYTLEERLAGHVDYEQNHATCPDHPDACSWGDQEGVIISTNDAIEVLEMIKRLKR